MVQMPPYITTDHNVLDALNIQYSSYCIWNPP